MAMVESVLKILNSWWNMEMKKKFKSIQPKFQIPIFWKKWNYKKTYLLSVMLPGDSWRVDWCQSENMKERI